MTRVKREKSRDTRDYDTTSLRENGNHGHILHRDYSAHFFRWSFARRFIKKTDHVLEVGCGPDTPLLKILFGNVQPYAERYLGVDLNPLRAINHQRANLIGEFNFVEDWKSLRPSLKAMQALAPFKPEGFDVAVNMEVIEHMKVEHGRELLKGLHGLLRPGGALLLSTPCYDGKRHAANHIHEYTVPELQAAIEKAGFKIVRRYGTFMDLRHIKKELPQKSTLIVPAQLASAVRTVYSALEEYFDNDALSNIFGPLYPDHARNNLWVCKK